MPYTDTTTFNTGATVVAAPRARLTDTAGAVLAASVSAGWQESTSAAGNTYTFTYAFPDGWRGRIDLLDNTTPVGVSAAVNPPAIDAATVAEIKTAAATLAGMTEADGPVRRYTANALELAPAGGGGGGGGYTGDGDTLVDHNTGGTDALRVLDPSNVAVDNAELLAYRKADYDAGIYTLRDRSITRSDGRWARPMSLNPAVVYTILIRKTGVIAPATVEVTPA